MITSPINTFTSEINASPEKIWEALTTAELVKQYFFGTNQQSSYQPGTPITWEGEFQGQSYKDHGTILESIPNRFLSYSYYSSWSGKEDHPDNYLYVAYELLPNQFSTMLTIKFSSYTNEGAEHSSQSWKGIIEGLKKLVE